MITLNNFKIEERYGRQIQLSLLIHLLILFVSRVMGSWPQSFVHGLSFVNAHYASLDTDLSFFCFFFCSAELQLPMWSTLFANLIPEFPIYLFRKQRVVVKNFTRGSFAVWREERWTMFSIFSTFWLLFSFVTFLSTSHTYSYRNS
jgi:hypothetical protein